jgi:hypothetical protein
VSPFLAGRSPARMFGYPVIPLRPAAPATRDIPESLESILTVQNSLGDCVPSFTAWRCRVVQAVLIFFSLFCDAVVERTGARCFPFLLFSTVLYPWKHQHRHSSSPCASPFPSLSLFLSSLFLMPLPVLLPFVVFPLPVLLPLPILLPFPVVPLSLFFKIAAQSRPLYVQQTPALLVLRDHKLLTD